MVLRTIRCLLIASLICAVALPSFAEDKKAPAGQPSPQDMEKMMAEYMKMAAPGPNHELLAKMAGEHSVTGRMCMSPDAEPLPMEPATDRGEMLFGGRYLRSHFEGKMMGMPFRGEGTLAYDNFKQKFLMTWLDEMSTTIATASGTYDAASKTMTLMGKMDEPMTGEKDKDVKYVYKFMDDKTWVFEMWDMLPGKPFKAMEMTYTKK